MPLHECVTLRAAPGGEVHAQQRVMAMHVEAGARRHGVEGARDQDVRALLEAEPLKVDSRLR